MSKAFFSFPLMRSRYIFTYHFFFLLRACLCVHECVFVCTCVCFILQVESKVCGTDGITYLNECLLKVASCRKQQFVTVASSGDCGEQICDAQWLYIYLSIYLSLMNSFILALIKLKLILWSPPLHHLHVLFFFSDLCKHVVCKYGARCEAGRCICPTQCPDTREPVCASNGLTYANECEMQKAACEVEGGLRVTFVGECSEARTSGVSK